MKVILLGSGAREHALARSLAHDPAVSTVIALPGNPGIATLARCLPGDPADPELVVEIATAEQVDLVVVGPEAPLVAGVADAVRAAGIPCFGPSAEAARIEGSKAFAKEIMAAAGVPTAAAHVCTTLDAVEAALTATGAPFVVKEDGLAAGKGVVVCTAREEALAHAAACLGREDGRVVVEDFLDGPEVSLFCLSDGRTVVPLEPAQDFKRVGDDDTGANTGGMGAYTPLPWTPEGLVQDVVRTVAEPTVRTLAERGMPFVGLLYIGLALTPVGPRVIEYNARFGDPETQAVLARLQTPLAGVLLAAAEGRLAELPPLEWSPESAVTVVVAAEGYPAGPLTGDPVSGLEDAESVDGVHVLQAGTRVEEPGDVAADAEPSATDGNAGRLVSAGGRVLSVVALGEDLTQARERAYGAVSRISLRGSHHRSDIAARAAAGQVLVPVIPGLLDADEPTRSPSQEP